MRNLLLDVFDVGWAGWQDAVIILLVVFIVLMIAFCVTFMLVNNSKNTAKSMARQVAWYEKRIEIKRRELEVEKARSVEALNESRKQLREKEIQALAAEFEAEKAKKALLEKEEEVKQAIFTAEMTKKELAEYQKREKTNVPEDFVINTVTEKVLKASEYKMRTEFSDCLIPVSITPVATDLVIKHISKKQDITNSSTSNGKETYKVEGKTFAIVSESNGIVKVTFKCGPAYASKLIKYAKPYITSSKFPQGIIWFTFEGQHGSSMELICQMIDISYRIAKLGY